MKKIKEMEFCEVMQLYEKGLVGEKEVKELCGIKINNENKSPKDSKDPYIALQRIEQARRNVEALSKMKDWEIDTVEDAIKKNIKIMNEVEGL